MCQRFLVLGDSVPHGARTEAASWPERVGRRIDDEVALEYRGGMATTLAGLADEPADHVNDTGAPTTVFVHAGHNDAQLSDDAARVSPERFRDASATLDRWLTDEPSVDNHAFVGLVPLLDLDEPESVPFADAQPGRSRRYDNRLADAVSTHVGVVASPPDWEARTVDGVHPNGAGHSAIADRVLAWLQ